MTKEDMVQVLKSVGVNENTVTAMCNAFDMGVAHERDRVESICKKHAAVYTTLPKTFETESAWAACVDLRDAIQRGEA